MVKSRVQGLPCLLWSHKDTSPIVGGSTLMTSSNLIAVKGPASRSSHWVSISTYEFGDTNIQPVADGLKSGCCKCCHPRVDHLGRAQWVGAGLCSELGSRGL